MGYLKFIRLLVLATAFPLGMTGLVAARDVRIWSYQELLHNFGGRMKIYIVAVLSVLSLCGFAQTNTPPSKVVMDPKSGQYAEVDAKKEIVRSYDRDGKVVWSNNVIESVNAFVGTRTNMFPRVTGRKIQGIQIYENALWVDLVRGYAILDIKTGEFKGINSR